MKNGIITLVVIVLIVGLSIYGLNRSTSKNTVNNYGATDQTQAQPTPVVEATTSAVVNNEPAMTIDKTKTYQAILTTTDGNITIDLNASQTPITVNNFVTLAQKKFYDGTIFHRVIKGFMIQAGDPEGTGTGGPGYQFDDEPFQGTYTRGTVAMANAGPNTNGSQFFIMLDDNDLPPNYVIFGKVSAGMDTVDKIGKAEVKASAQGEMSTPVTPVKVTSVKIVEK